MRVFVSHSSADKDFCDALVHAVRGAGADVWYDEHSGTGQLLDEINKQLRERPVFLVVLSKAAFGSKWVLRECLWAFNLSDRDPSRIYLPIVAAPLDRADFDAALYLEDFKRVEGPGDKPYPRDEAIARTLRLLALTPAGQAPAPTAPQPAERAEDLIARGRALNAQDQYAQALPLFERATQLAPASFDAWANLGYTDNMLQRWLEGLAAHDCALALDPNSVVAWDNKGAALNGLGRSAEALVACERALALDPNYALAWIGKGAALNDLKRYAEALAAYDRALALDPNFAIAWTNKAIALRALGREAEAREAERRAKAVGG